MEVFGITLFMFIVYLIIQFDQKTIAQTIRENDTWTTDLSANKLVEKNTRKKKLYIFNIIKFSNDACVATDGKNGTCYTVQECNSKAGSHSGSCAEGYGVCCTFSLTCGRTIAENCTYFQSSGGESGSCTTEVCPCSNNICRLRLDFSTFSINGPSSLTTSVTKLLNGVQSPSSGLGGASIATLMTECIEDQFTVTSPGNPSPSVICGINSGEHMYVDSSKICNKLSFQIGQRIFPRKWDIKITQIPCDFVSLAPDGCTQWFYGSSSGFVQSYNFAGNLHLANQDQNICVRRERNNCRICWSHASLNFDLSSGNAINIGNIGKSSMCCGYGPNGVNTIGYDCVIIPSASKATSNSVMIGNAADEFCGRALASVINGPPVTICSQRSPFQLRFLSDNYEFSNEAMKFPKGFRLYYSQLMC